MGPLSPPFPRARQSPDALLHSHSETDSLGNKAADGSENLASQVGGLRVRIDGLNDQIMQILCIRAEVVLLIGALKSKAGMEIYDPGRECDQLRMLNEKRGPYTEGDIGRIFGTIFDVSRGLQGRPLFEQISSTVADREET